jgi:hypothetical protein
VTERVPAMRQKILNPASGLSRETFEHVLEVKIRIESVELCGLDKTHDVGSALAGAQRASK